MQEVQTPKKSGLVIGLAMSAVLVLAGLGGGYFWAASQPQQWKASAKFDVPKVADLGNYFSLYSTYQLVQNDGKADPNLEKNAAEASYNEFKRLLTTLDNRQQFLANNATVKQVAEVYNKPLNDMVNQLSEKLHFDETTNTLSFSMSNPELAVRVLNEFITQNTTQAREALNNDLIAKWKFLFQNVKQSAEANLGESWKGKLNLMRSVQPLDNALIAYNMVQKPVAATQPEQPENLHKSLGIGGAVGLLLGLLFAFTRRR